jgi:hypothetical protein
MQNNQSQTAPSFTPTTEGKSVEQGKWMYFSEATVATNKSEKTLKRYIKKGELKWRRMGKQTNSPIQVWITGEFLSTVGSDTEQRVEDLDIFDADAHEVDFSPSTEQGPAEPIQDHHPDENPYERMVKTMVSEFTVQLDRQRDVLFDLRRELEQKDNQLRLLPDLQRQLEEKEKVAHIQLLALEKQIEALKTNVQSQEKMVEELQSDKEERVRVTEALAQENEKRAKIAEDLRLENEVLRAEAEKLKAKRGWLSWFLGRSDTQ